MPAKFCYPWITRLLQVLDKDWKLLGAFLWGERVGETGHCKKLTIKYLRYSYLCASILEGA
jgi:hypothetical protein